MQRKLMFSCGGRDEHEHSASSVLALLHKETNIQLLKPKIKQNAERASVLLDQVHQNPPKLLHSSEFALNYFTLSEINT